MPKFTLPKCTRKATRRMVFCNDWREPVPMCGYCFNEAKKNEDKKYGTLGGFRSMHDPITGTICQADKYKEK